MENLQPAGNYYKDQDWAPEPQKPLIMTRSRANQIKRTNNSSSNNKTLKVENNSNSPVKDTSPKHRVLEKVSNSANIKKNGAGMSEYELQIQKNIDERKKMFEMLKLGSFKEDLGELFSQSIKRKTDANESDSSDQKPVKRGRPLKEKKKAVVYIDTAVKKGNALIPKSTQSEVRRTLRPRKPTKYFDYLEAEMEVSPPKVKREQFDTIRVSPSGVDLCDTTPKTSRPTRGQRNRRTSPLMQQNTGEHQHDINLLTFENTYAYQNSIEESSRFLNDFIPFMKKPVMEYSKPARKDISEFLGVMKTLELTSEGIVSVVRRKITSLAWHPNSDRLLLAAGDFYGSIGFLDVRRGQSEIPTTKASTHAYDVHTSCVTGLTFDQYNPLRLLSASKDGYVRLVDFQAGIFNQVYSSPLTSINDYPTHIVQKGSSSVIVAKADGHIVTVDLRSEPWRIDQQFKCFETSIPTLSNHPLDDNLIMAGCINGETRIFDLRYTGRSASECLGCVDPVIQLPKLSSRINGAFFSPLTGEKAIVTGKNLLEIFDLRGGTTEILKNWDATRQQKSSELSYGSWHPDREDVFIAMRNDDYEKVAVFGVPNGECLHSFENNGISRSQGFSVFHPTVPVLAGGSLTSGLVHLFSSSV